ncbi:SRPBCC family protein [Streptomyces macrosporus]|uniref:Coenzyme Q-binding protein COQ10 START domain-containing protein n=1 Tax=Streptomyces macrosporus TaxID=44032 RepID=A0ABN3K9B4_9ACTN
MADNTQDTAQDGSGFDRLKEELGDFLHAQARHWVGSVGDRLGHLTDRIHDGDGGGVLSIGRRVLGGESPVKAIVSEKAKGLKDKVVGGVKGVFGGGGGEGGGKAGSIKVTNIIETVDIGLPRRTVYDAWTQLEEFNTFTKGVQSVSMSDEVESDWRVKIAFSNRSWKATIQEQIPDERIVWDSEGPKGTTRGAVSFHELTPNLTRVVVVVEYYPSGFFEKTGNLWRAQGRRLRLDLKHFQRHVTLTGKEELGEGWRGEIRDGEVVLSHEDAVERERRESGEGREKPRRGEERGEEEEEEPRRGEERGEEEEEEPRRGEEEGEEEEEEEEYDDEEDEYDDEEDEGDEEDYDEEEEDEDEGRRSR